MGKEMEEKNKYQEALDNAVHDIDYKYHDFGEYIPKERLDEIKLLQKLVDKEMPKEPIKEPMIKEFKLEILQCKCPTCKIGKVGQICDNGRKKEGIGFTNYCPNCGQKLKW